MGTRNRKPTTKGCTTDLRNSFKCPPPIVVDAKCRWAAAQDPANGGYSQICGVARQRLPSSMSNGVYGVYAKDPPTAQSVTMNVENANGLGRTPARKGCWGSKQRRRKRRLYEAFIKSHVVCYG